MALIGNNSLLGHRAKSDETEDTGSGRSRSEPPITAQRAAGKAAQARSGAPLDFNCAPSRQDWYSSANSVSFTPYTQTPRSKTQTCLLLYHTLLSIEWFSILSMTTYHLFVDDLAGSKGAGAFTGTAFARITRWAQDEITRQNSQSPVLRRSHTLYQAVGFSIMVTHTLEIIHIVNALLGGWRFRMLNFSVRKECIRWVDRSFIVYWILENFSAAQKSSTFAVLAVTWSIMSLAQHVSLVRQLLFRDTKPLRRFNRVTSGVLISTAAASECYLIYETIPRSCIWWPSTSIKDIAAFVFDPQILYRSSEFQWAVFDWMSTGLYSKSGDYLRSGMFFFWVVGWASYLLGPSWLVLSALLFASLLIREQHIPQSLQSVL